MEHYANYRAQIRRLGEENPLASNPEGSADALRKTEMMDTTSFYPAPKLPEEDVGDGKKSKNNPYRLYLARRRRIYLIQIIVFLVMAAGFGVWLYFLLGRSM